MIRNNRFLLIMAVSVLVAAAGLVGWSLLSRSAPAASSVAVPACAAADCAVFPQVDGRNLLGEDITLPNFFDGKVNMVVMPFSQDQQVEAADWLSLVEELAERYEGFAYYNVAAMPAVNPAIRTMITGGMAAAIPEDDIKSIVVMLFLEDVEAFIQALNIDESEALALMLLDIDGNVLWQGGGAYDEAVADEIRREVARRLE